MGLVYEAEEIESGRRVALKVLEQRFSDERERERFEREGRLAASIDHEHCVFVFGAAEIDGVPAIAMELMQGTLADRLAAEGPLPPAAAVDVALQLVAGLQAAAEAGILHRDVKPSNCFVDADGVVKIGDFGISRSLRPADETALSTRNRLAATPTYASPEQLRGATLDARADIYSLGATLYELVTGRRPFTAPDLMSLLMAVANDAPAPPHQVVPTVPRGLSRVILRCLAKRPEDRYASYAALAAALEPYASVSPTPATLGRRFIAGVVDQMTLGLLQRPDHADARRPGHGRAGLAWNRDARWPRTLTILLLYYGGCEALWARTPGKALLGLTLVDRGGRPPRPSITFARAMLFAAPNLALGLGLLALWGPSIHGITSETGRVSTITFVGQLLLLAALFSTARRRNGYAALHDLATATASSRQRALTAERTAGGGAGVASTGAPVVGRRGSFAVLDGTIEGRPGWQPGIDERLRRPVWIRDLPIGTPAVAAARVALSRPTRLRWLAGRRTSQEAWDVYEGVAGVPIARGLPVTAVVVGGAAVAGGPRPRARRAAARRPPAPRSRSRLDPGLGPGQAARRSDRRPAIRGQPTGRRPRPAARGGAAGARAQPPAVAVVGDAFRRHARRGPARLVVRGRTPRRTPCARGRAAISRGWRGLSIAALVALPASACPMAARRRGVGGGDGAAGARPGTRRGSRAARAGPAQRRPAGAGPGRSRGRGDRARVALPIACSPTSLYAPERFLRLTPGAQGAGRPHPAPERRPAIGGRGRGTARGARHARGGRDESYRLPVSWHAVDVPVVLLRHAGVVALVGLMAAFARRGVLLRFLGFEVVTADGRRAPRWRVLARAAIAWSPLLLPVLVWPVRGWPRGAVFPTR